MLSEVFSYYKDFSLLCAIMSKYVLLGCLRQQVVDSCKFGSRDWKEVDGRIGAVVRFAWLISPKCISIGPKASVEPRSDL